MIIAVPATLAALAATLVGFLAYVYFKYGRIIARIFEESPTFMPLRVPAEVGGEEVRFRAADGLNLVGTYLPHRAARRVGVVVFAHEYLSDRWSYRPYADSLRDLGFDLFTFDARNHGESDAMSGYSPLQWTSDLETMDLRAALAYLRSRPDGDPAGVGLYGISRGGSAALCVAGKDMGVWGVVTDGAFSTRGTMLFYTLRWAEIYVTRLAFWAMLPTTIWKFAGWAGRHWSRRKSGRRYPDVDRAASRLAPRPWLMIHGGTDNYIKPETAKALFAHAGEPKELWIVPKAKHNRCREVDPQAYRAKVEGFFRRYAPRRVAEVGESASEVEGGAVAVAASIING